MAEEFKTLDFADHECTVAQLLAGNLMPLSHKSRLDAVSNVLLMKQKRRKWDWLTVRGLCSLLISLALVANAAATPAYPLRPSANHRYVIDSKNAPFLIIGDAPHSILANLNNSDATTYLTDRGSRGFNALWIELLCDSYTFGYGDEGQANYGRDVNGNNPFTGTLTGGYYDLTTPNEAYWSHVDYIVQQAGVNGLQCLFTPLDQGGWTQTSLVNGTSRCQQYGQFLGNRYKNYPNIIWNFGNDFQQWRNQQNDAVILAIADGLRSADLSHLITIQLDYYVSESQDDPNWIPRINTNGVYTYYPTYAETLVAYNKPTVMPVLFLEENYEDEANVGELGTPKVLRRQEYWSLTGGALAGHMYGSYWTDRFASGWQSHLNTQAVAELGYFKAFITSVAWYNLVPDQTHSLLTAGYGTFSDSGHVGDNDYAMAAKVLGRFSGDYLYACLAQHDGCDGKLRRAGNGKVVRPDEQHVSNYCQVRHSRTVGVMISRHRGTITAATETGYCFCSLKLARLRRRRRLARQLPRLRPPPRHHRALRLR